VDEKHTDKLEMTERQIESGHVVPTIEQLNTRSETNLLEAFIKSPVFQFAFPVCLGPTVKLAAVRKQSRVMAVSIHYELCLILRRTKWHDS
jgi:hypothetical protein